MGGQHDGKAQISFAPEPQAVIQAADRLVLAYVDVLELCCDERSGAPSILSQRRESERLIAMRLMDAEEADGRHREKLVDRQLHIGAHVTGKLPRRGDDLFLGQSGKMP